MRLFLIALLIAISYAQTGWLRIEGSFYNTSDCSGDPTDWEPLGLFPENLEPFKLDKCGPFKLGDRRRTERRELQGFDPAEDFALFSVTGDVLTGNLYSDSACTAYLVSEIPETVNLNQCTDLEEEYAIYRLVVVSEFALLYDLYDNSDCSGEPLANQTLAFFTWDTCMSHEGDFGLIPGPQQMDCDNSESLRITMYSDSTCTSEVHNAVFTQEICQPFMGGDGAFVKYHTDATSCPVRLAEWVGNMALKAQDVMDGGKMLWRWNFIKPRLGKMAFCGEENMNWHKDYFGNLFDQWHSGGMGGSWDDVKSGMSSWIANNIAEDDPIKSRRQLEECTCAESSEINGQFSHNGCADSPLDDDGFWCDTISANEGSKCAQGWMYCTPEAENDGNGVESAWYKLRMSYYSNSNCDGDPSRHTRITASDADFNLQLNTCVLSRDNYRMFTMQNGELTGTTYSDSDCTQNGNSTLFNQTCQGCADHQYIETSYCDTYGTHAKYHVDYVGMFSLWDVTHTSSDCSDDTPVSKQVMENFDFGNCHPDGYGSFQTIDCNPFGKLRMNIFWIDAECVGNPVQQLTYNVGQCIPNPYNESQYSIVVSNAPECPDRLADYLQATATRLQTLTGGDAALWRWKKAKKLLGKLSYCGTPKQNPYKNVFESLLDEWFADEYKEATYNSIRDAVDTWVNDNLTE